MKKPTVQNNEANALAARIWEGQSPDLPLNERVKRIVAALKARNFDIAGLQLPDPEAERYL